MSYRVKLKWLPTRSNAGEVIDKSHWGDGDEALYTCARTPLLSDYTGFPEWKRTREEDILLTRNGTPYIHLPEPNSIYSNVVQRVSLPGKNRRYIRYALEAEVASFRGYGVSIESLNYQMWGNLKITLHEPHIQKRIADFLDNETVRIDQLIEKRSRFAELVLERRLAVVSKSITGATDDAPWLETLPEGWKADRAKAHFRESQKRSAAGEEELLTVSHITGVTKRSEKDVYMFMAESNEGYKLVSPGDLIINTMWAWMGAMGVSSEYGLISPSYGVYTPVSDALRPAFVDLMVRSKPFIAEATRRSKGIHSSRLRLYPDAFLDMRLPIPPLETQDAMLGEVSSRLQREDELLRKNARAETLLREFRSALITAAVTGQIDVTTWGKQGQTDRRLDEIEEAMQA